MNVHYTRGVTLTSGDDVSTRKGIYTAIYFAVFDSVFSGSTYFSNVSTRDMQFKMPRDWSYGYNAQLTFPNTTGDCAIYQRHVRLVKIHYKNDII